MSETLLLPVDASPASEQAVRLLCAWRGEKSAIAPVVLNVQQRPVSLWPQPLPDPGAIESALREAGARVVEPARAALAKAGLAVEHAVRLGIPAQAILEEAGRHPAGAIVMGTRARHGLSSLGSVATRVVHGSAVPVVLVTPEARLPAAFGVRLQVLLPVDGSAHSLRAVDCLVRWRAWLGELSVDLLYAQAPLTVIEALLPPHRDALKHWGGGDAEHATREARARLEAAGIRHELKISAGEPAACIAGHARDAGCEFIVMGTRGLGAAHHALIGSVALNTMERAGVPVTLMP